MPFVSCNKIPGLRYEVASDTAAISLTAENQGVYILSSLQTSLLPPDVIVREFREDYYRVMGYMVKSLKNATPALAEFIRTAEAVVADQLVKKNDLLRSVNRI